MSKSVLTPSAHKDCHSRLLFSGSSGKWPGHVDATSGERQLNSKSEIRHNSNREGGRELEVVCTFSSAINKKKEYNYFENTFPLAQVSSIPYLPQELQHKTTILTPLTGHKRKHILP